MWSKVSSLFIQEQISTFVEVDHRSDIIVDWWRAAVFSSEKKTNSVFTYVKRSEKLTVIKIRPKINIT